MEEKCLVHRGETNDESDVAEQQEDAMEAKKGYLGISSVDIMSKNEHLCVPQESSFPVPLKYFDAVRRTSTTLAVWQERQVGDSWNLDGDPKLSPWTGFTQFKILNHTEFSGIHVVRGRIDENSSDVQA